MRKVFYLTLLISSVFSFSYGLDLFKSLESNFKKLEKEAKSSQDLRTKIDDEFRKAGIKDGYVQYSTKYHGYVLKGDYDTEQQFNLAYMIAQAMVGVRNVSPVYDITSAVIKTTTIEECFPYAINGESCPYQNTKITINPSLAKYSHRRKYALVIGISKFEHVNPLSGGDNDAKLMTSYLKSHGYKVYKLINSQATQSNVFKDLSIILSKLKPGDTFVLFAASHGAPKDPQGETGVVLYDSTAVNNENSTYCQKAPAQDPTIEAASKMCALVSHSLSLDKDVLPYLRGKNVKFVAILDTCYSGDALRGYLGDVPAEYVAPADFYDKVLEEKAPKSLVAFVSATSGFRESWGGPVGYSEPYFSRAFEIPASRFILSNRSIYDISNRSLNSKGAKNLPNEVNDGAFSLFFVNALKKSNGDLDYAYKFSKPYIDDVSYKMCLLANKASSRSIGVTSKSQKTASKTVSPVLTCPPGGQNPMLLLVHGKDFNFITGG